MAVQGKKLNEWIARTYCNFGDPNRKEALRDHYSLDAAFRAYEKINKIYGRSGRCWQETREGVVINDNNHNG